MSKFSDFFNHASEEERARVFGEVIEAATARQRRKIFEVGKSYGVLRLDDAPETVTVAANDGRTVTLTDGRKARILKGVAPDGSDEQVLRLNEHDPCADVVRVCHEVKPQGAGGGG